MTKGKSYTLKLRHTDTNRSEQDGPDYDRCGLINDSADTGVRQGLNGTGVVIVEDSDGLLTHETHGMG